MTTVTVAIPVRNGGARLDEVLAAVAAQQIDAEVEILVCDSGSTDGSATSARRHGAEVIRIEPADFGHGRTRNLLMTRAAGGHVALLTQDAVPADPGWLAALLAGFSLAPDVGLVFGPYRPRPGASPMVARELTQWFASFSADGGPRVDRIPPGERKAGSEPELWGHRGYFTDANGCVARAAWERVPFRDVAYAEDHLLAADMLRAGYAKAFAPGAVVVHSHDYTAREWLRRSFDEARAVREVYGATPGGDIRTALLSFWGTVGADHRWIGDPAHLGHRVTRSERARWLAASAVHHGARTVGGLLGAHAGALPPTLAAQLSLERRR